MNVDKYHSEVATFKAQNSKTQNAIVIRRSTRLNQSRMKQAKILMVALGITFIVGCSTARYLLVEIDSVGTAGLERQGM